MRRLLVGAVAVGVLAPTWALAGHGVQAGEPPSGDLEVVLVEQRFAVTANGRWVATFALEGDVAGLDLSPTTTTTTTATTSPPPATDAAETVPPATRPAAAEGDAQLRTVVYRPIENRDELAEFIDGDERNAIDELVDPLAPAVTTSAGGETELHVDVATTIEPSVEGALHLRRAGLYPIAVQVLVDGDVVAEHRTFLDRRPLEASTAPPLSIALLASVPAVGPDDAEELSDDQRAELEALVDLAERYEGPLTVALPPATLPGLSAEAPELEDALRVALDGDELLSLPSSPLDPSSAVAVGQADTFVRRLRDGEDALDEALPGSAAARSGWVATTPISTGAATMLRDLAFDLLVLDEATYGQLDGNIGGFLDTTLAVDVDLGDGGSVPAVVLSPLGVLLDPGRPSADRPAATAVQILANLITTQRLLGDDQRRGVVLTAPDGRPDADVANALATMAGELDEVRLVELSTISGAIDTMVVDDRPTTVSLPAQAGPDLAARLDRIELTRVSAESAASMQLDDTDRTRWRAELDALITTALSDEQVDEALADIADEAEAIRASVVSPQPFDFTLTGRSSTLRVNVRNNSDESLQVLVRARSPKLTFPDGEQLVELVPAGSTEVVIPVEARANGTSSIEVQLVTPALGPADQRHGRADRQRQRADRSRAGDHGRRLARPGVVVVQPPTSAAAPALARRGQPRVGGRPRRDLPGRRRGGRSTRRV